MTRAAQQGAAGCETGGDEGWCDHDGPPLGATDFPVEMLRMCQLADDLEVVWSTLDKPLRRFLRFSYCCDIW